MRCIAIAGGGARITFSPHFYRMPSIAQAAEDFSEACSFDFTEGDDLVASIRPKERLTDEELRVLAMEFCNYVLGHMRNHAVV